MSDLEGLLAGIALEPVEEVRWLVLADWLEENDDPRRGELLRLHRRLLATCRNPDEHPERAAWQARLVELLVEGVRPCVPQKTLLINPVASGPFGFLRRLIGGGRTGEAASGGLPVTFSMIPPGTFRMGDDRSDAWGNNRPAHTVVLTRSVYLGSTPVTQAQWKALMGSDPSYHKGADRPVERVSWDQCRMFCKRLTERLNGEWDVRLPTEAEWEWACRAGSTTQYYSGDGESALKMAGWYDGNSGGESHSVAQLVPNAWGLYDTHGNVWEWCQDAFEEYQVGAAVDPTGAVTDSTRVCRGGCAGWSADCCESAGRGRYTPDLEGGTHGFRVALVPRL